VRVVVLGATGFVGRALVPALAEHAEVVAVSRRGGTPEADSVRAVAADATEATAMRRALDGADVVYYLVHSLGAAEYAEIDRRAATTVASSAASAGVSQIVFLGGLGDDAPDLSPHLRSRAETAAVLVAGSVPVTTLRAAVVVGHGSAGFETIVAQGLSNEEIGQRLFISETTVKTHVTHVLQKLDLRDRVQVVVLAHQTGMLEDA